METRLNDFSSGLFIAQTLFLFTILLFIYVLYDITKNKFEKNNKTIWFLFVLFVPIIGSFFYLLIGKKKKLS